MRLAELVGINITDIRGDELVVTGKGNKERTVYLNNSCISAIKSYLKIRQKMSPESKDKNALFLSERNKRTGRFYCDTGRTFCGDMCQCCGCRYRGWSVFLS